MRSQVIGALLILVLGWGGRSCDAAELTVSVKTAEGKPLSDAAVYAMPLSGSAVPSPNLRAIMDQLHKEFVPHVLVVQLGTAVDFPNNDNINHHVYSFSPAKIFQLKLFKNNHERHFVVFDKPGVVTLGCNIHDWMLGYIFVVDTPLFGKTDDHGDSHIAVPDSGNYLLKLWHPQANENLELLNQSLKGLPDRQHIEIHLQKPLKPEYPLSHDSDEYGR